MPNGVFLAGHRCCVPKPKATVMRSAEDGAAGVVERLMGPHPPQHLHGAES